MKLIQEKQRIFQPWLELVVSQLQSSEQIPAAEEGLIMVVLSGMVVGRMEVS